MKNALLIILALCSFIAIASAQKKEPSIAKSDVLLSKDKPTLYITFERTGKIRLASPRLMVTNVSSERADIRTVETNQEESEVVWLRLHNNTCWAISFPTESLYIGAKTTMIRLSDGRAALAPREGLEVNARYEVEAERNSEIVKLPIIRRADVMSNTWLAPGHSVTFAVSRDHLAKSLMIYIPFNYEWESGEQDRGSGEPEHRIYFRASDLPELIR
jgi:hypothetical protein